MPCRDYESDSYGYDDGRWKAQADKLARISCAVMKELIAQGKADFLLLKNEEIRQWWAQHQIDDAKAAAERKRKREAAAEKKRLENLKKDLLAKLTPDEKKALGIK